METKPQLQSKNKISRREFFQKSKELATGAATALITLKTSRATKSLGEIEILTEHLNPQSFSKKWEQAMANGLTELEKNPEFIQKFGQEKVMELAGILKKFDINQYINSLANLAEIERQNINGELLNFTVKLGEQSDPMAKVDDRVHIVLFIDEWAYYKNSFHQETIYTVLSHELSHILSFNYNDPTKHEIPWRRSEDWPVGYAIGVSKYFYEGATEFVAIAPQLQQGGSKTLEQGYRGGGTLAAFIIAELIGWNNFIKAYITRDPKLLIKALEEKIGKGASKNLLLPAENSFFSNLDELDKIFRSQNIYQYAKKPQDIIDRAWELGIKEKTQYFAFDGFTMTTHLYLINDADASSQFAFNAIVAGPKIYRTGKIKNFQGKYHLHQLLFYIHSHTPISDFSVKMKQTIAELQMMIQETSPNTFFNSNPQLQLEAPGIIKETLEQLNKIDNPYSSEFTFLWNTINAEAQKFVKNLGMNIIEQAGATNLIADENTDQKEAE